VLWPNVGHVLHDHEVSRSHTTTQHTQWDSFVRVICLSHKRLPDNTQHSQQTFMPPRDSNPYPQLPSDLAFYYFLNSVQNVMYYILLKKSIIDWNKTVQGAHLCKIYYSIAFNNRRRERRDLRRRSATIRVLGFGVRMPPSTLKSVCCVCYVLSGRDLCDEPITHPE
jgi:hypothetical protein